MDPTPQKEEGRTWPGLNSTILRWAGASERRHSMVLRSAEKVQRDGRPERVPARPSVQKPSKPKPTNLAAGGFTGQVRCGRVGGKMWKDGPSSQPSKMLRNWLHYAVTPRSSEMHLPDLLPPFLDNPLGLQVFCSSSRFKQISKVKARPKPSSV